jgi:ABC-type uncharacterized transport system permease subunit
VIQALSVFTPALYLVALVPHFMSLSGVGGERLARWRLGLLLLALAAHAGLFAARAVEAGGMPVLGAWEAISAVALAVGVLYAAVGWSTGQFGTGAVVLSVVFAAQLVSSAVAPLESVPAPPRPAPFYLLHVASILVASAALTLSGLHGLLYLLLFRNLRRHRIGPLLERLPSLETLVELTRRAAFVAFLLLLVGVNGGIWWAHQAAVPGFTYTDPGVLAVLGLCLHFGIVAFSRRIPGLTARRASYAAAPASCCWSFPWPS